MPTVNPTAGPTDKSTAPSPAPSWAPSFSPTFSEDWFKERGTLIQRDHLIVSTRANDVKQVKLELNDAEAKQAVAQQTLEKLMRPNHEMTGKQKYNFWKKNGLAVILAHKKAESALVNSTQHTDVLQKKLTAAIQRLQDAETNQANELRNSTNAPTPSPTNAPTPSPTSLPTSPLPTRMPTISVDFGADKTRHYGSALRAEVKRAKRHLPSWMLPKGIPAVRIPPLDEASKKDQHKMNKEMSVQEDSYLHILQQLSQETGSTETKSPKRWYDRMSSGALEVKHLADPGGNQPTLHRNPAAQTLYQHNLADRKNFMKFFTPLWYNGRATPAPTLPAARTPMEKLVKKGAANIAHVMAIQNTQSQAVRQQNYKITSLIKSMGTTSKDLWGHSFAPTVVPTSSPTLMPTPPTNAPTARPTPMPTVPLTSVPTSVPTPAPTNLCPLGFDELLLNETDPGSVIVTYAARENRRCCSADKNAEDFLDLFRDGNLGGATTFASCKQACTADRDCQFFEIAHRTLIDSRAKSWCSGFVLCDTVCNYPEMHESQTILKLDRARKVVPADTAIASYGAGINKKCCSKAGAQGKEEENTWCDLFDDGVRGRSATFIQCSEACAAHNTCMFFEIAHNTATSDAETSWCRGFTSCSTVCDAPELKGNQSIFKQALCRERIEPPIYLTDAPTAMPTLSIWSKYILPTPAPTGNTLQVSLENKWVGIDMSSFYTEGPTAVPTPVPTAYPTKAVPTSPPTPKPTPSRWQDWKSELSKDRKTAMAKAEKFTQMIVQEPNIRACPIPGRTYCNSGKKSRGGHSLSIASQACSGKERCVFLHEDHVSRWGCCG
jgi:hypothetical protein